MKCPICNIDLVMTDRSGVEIDYCPECRGVWLDRGELDKIIERSVSTIAPGSIPNPVQPQRESYGKAEHRFEESNAGQYDSRGGYKKPKKESFLADLFDF